MDEGEFSNESLSELLHRLEDETNLLVDFRTDSNVFDIDDYLMNFRETSNG